MENKTDKGGTWLYLLAIVAFLVAVLALVEMAQVSATALASAPAQSKGGSDSSSAAQETTPAQDKGALTNPAAPLAGAVVPVVQEGLEQGSLVYTQLTQAIPTCVPGGCGWQVVTTAHHNGAYSVHGSDVAGTSDQQLLLNSPAVIPANATLAVLTWWQRYDFEHVPGHNYDGGVLELSTDGGTTWTDGGALLTVGPYSVTLEAGTTNPLAGRSAWGGTTGANWVTVQANLMSYRGVSLLFRLRLGTDADNNGQANPAGWWVDDLYLAYQADVLCDPYGWTTAAPYPQIMADTAVASQGGQVYSFGGLNAMINTASYGYNPGPNTWTPIAGLPSARYYAAAASDGTYIYVLGGRDASINPTNTVYRYNPTTNSYTTLAPLSENLYEVGAAVLNGYLYRIGGHETGSTYTSSVEAYSLTTHTWAPVASLPQTGGNQAVIAYGGYLYVAGGETGSGSATAKTYRYDPVANIWDDAAIPDLPGARTAIAAAFYNNHWLLAGGQGNGTGYLASALAWDPVTNSWSSRARLSAPHGASQAGSAGGKFIAPGGVDAQSFIISTVLSYSETTCPPSTPTPSPTACPLQFTDVAQGSTFYPYIRCLACRGIVGGYTSNPPCTTGVPCFLPGSNVTRGQMAKFVSNAANYQDVIPPSQQTFTDVPPNSTFWLYVERAYLHSVISGYTSVPPCAVAPCFLPGNNVTRGQAAKFVSIAAGYTDLIPPNQQTFADVAPNSTFWVYIERVFLHGVISGYTSSPPCTTGTPCFIPANNVTRGQTAKFISNAFFPNCQTPSGRKE
jgi:N-acetylneuraminic acid mutarotase